MVSATGSIAVTVTVSSVAPAPTISCSPTNMPSVESTATVNTPIPVAPASSTGPGSETRPACPTSCCSSAVALRTPECISERLVILWPRRVMSIVEPTTMPEITRRTAIDTSISMSVNPPWPAGFGGASPSLQLPACRGECVSALLFTGSSERKRLECGYGGAGSQRPSPLRVGHCGRNGDLLQVLSHATTWGSNGADLPDPLVVPTVGRLPIRRRQERAGEVEIVHVQRHRRRRIAAAAERQAAAVDIVGGKHARIRRGIAIRQSHQLFQLVLRVLR